MERTKKLVSTIISAIIEARKMYFENRNKKFIIGG